MTQKMINHMAKHRPDILAQIAIDTYKDMKSAEEFKKAIEKGTGKTIGFKKYDTL